MSGSPDILGANILVVDDQQGNVGVLEQMLREAGYSRVSSTLNSREVCALHRKNAYDLILLDLNMPGLDGFEVMAALSADEPDSYLPVIVMTAHPGHKLRALQAGAKDFITVPLDLVEARTRIHNMLEVRMLYKRLESYNGLLDQSNQGLEAANAELQARQVEIASTNHELARANQFKTEFLSTMSHELRSPLNAIIGFSELLSDHKVGELAPRQREFLSYIVDSGKHLLALINDILDLTKIEAGKVELDLELVDLDGLLADAANLLRESALARTIRLEIQGSGHSRPLRVDRRRLKQITYNVVSNALKFTSPGGQVSVKATFVDRRQASTGLPGFEAGVRSALPDTEFESFAQVSVSDTGVGISAEGMARLFTPFTQLKSGLPQAIEGTGLGLVTVLRLVQLHGGAVAVTSKAGSGSCFSFWLPRRTPEMLPDRAPDAT
jgi:two-component system, NtrC family, sensor kinase